MLNYNAVIITFTAIAGPSNIRLTTALVLSEMRCSLFTSRSTIFQLLSFSCVGTETKEPCQKIR